MPGELIPVALFFSIAAIAIFRPLTKRLGAMIESSHREKRSSADPEIERLTRLMEHLVDRLDRLEDRVDFTERMLESGPRRRPGAARNGQSADPSSDRPGTTAARVRR